MNHGVKPNKLWHWAAIAVIIATVIHNPGGAAEFSITALDKTGSAIAWGLTRGGFEGESDYFVDPELQQESKTAPTTGPEPEPGPELDPLQTPPEREPESAPLESPPTTTASTEESRYHGPTEALLRARADQAVVEVIRLHELVETVLAEDDRHEERGL